MHLYLAKDKSARRPRSATLAALREGLDDVFHVWANVSYEKYEFDWLVFCERGWFGVYEEKTFDRPVVETAGLGEPWTLAGGKQVDNPGEQVNRHSEAFRGFVRREVIPRFAPETSDTDVRNISVWCGVVSPHVTEKTRLVQPRWGRFYESLEAFVRDISERAPNVLLALDAATAEAVVNRLNEKLLACPAGPEDVSSSAATQDEDVGELTSDPIEELHRRIEALEQRVTTLEKRPSYPS